jgi:hypothetical protein
MSGTSIILEPEEMFNALSYLEMRTRQFVRHLHTLSGVLEEISILTYAIGFGELIKKAEREINQNGSAVVAANNALNTACTHVVNQLVAKFASLGVKSDYSEPPFHEVHIKINVADRAAIYPPAMKALFDDLYNVKIRDLNYIFDSILQTYRRTAKFWVGTSASKTRRAIQDKLAPEYEQLETVLMQIVNKGYDWIEEAQKFEASLGVY